MGKAIKENMTIYHGGSNIVTSPEVPQEATLYENLK